MASPSSRKNKVALAALAALAALVATLGLVRLHRSSVPGPARVASEPGASPPSLAPSAAREADGAASAVPRADLPPVYLRIEGVRLLRPTLHARAHVRANVNAAYYDYPSPSGGELGWVAIDSKMAPEHFAITRSYYYEVYFELRIMGADTLSGASLTLNLTSPAAAASDKLPYHADYELYATGHGFKAAKPSAVLSYSITETP